MVPSCEHIKQCDWLTEMCMVWLCNLWAHIAAWWSGWGGVVEWMAAAKRCSLPQSKGGALDTRRLPCTAGKCALCVAGPDGQRPRGFPTSGVQCKSCRARWQGSERHAKQSGTTTEERAVVRMSNGVQQPKSLGCN